MGEAAIGSRDVVEQIWRRVALRDSLAAEPRIEPAPEFPVLEHDPERHFVNRHCILDRSPHHVPAAGRLAKLKAPLKRRVATFVVGALERYFDTEEVFLAHLVRYQNNVAESHDRLARSVTNLHRQFGEEMVTLRHHMLVLQATIEEQNVVLAAAGAAPQGASSSP